MGPKADKPFKPYDEIKIVPMLQNHPYFVCCKIICKSVN